MTAALRDPNYTVMKTNYMKGWDVGPDINLKKSYPCNVNVEFIEFSTKEE
jgi:hypothetical protein